MRLQALNRAPLCTLQVRGLIHSLLVRIGRHHPQALMYPLLVACKSQSPSRRAAAYSVLEAVRQHSATLVEQAQLVRAGVCQGSYAGAQVLCLLSCRISSWPPLLEKQQCSCTHGPSCSGWCLFSSLVEADRD